MLAAITGQRVFESLHIVLDEIRELEELVFAESYGFGLARPSTSD
jgi:hypothetical protein